MSFQAAADYCLACSDDSSEGDYDLTRECFVVVIGEPHDNDDIAVDATRAATATAKTNYGTWVVYPGKHGGAAGTAGATLRA